MTLVPLVLITGLAAIASLALIYLRKSERELRALKREREERHAALSRTSKLLIDKNMELFDQNLRQQQEIKTKEDFIGIVSHQLRTPATEVEWGIEAMGGELVKQHRRGRELAYFKKVQASAERLVRLVDSLVRLMSVDEPLAPPVINPYEPDPVVQAVARELAERFKEKHINLTLVLGAPGALEVIDVDSLRLVTENLIENAYEYTAPEGTVTVSTERGEDGRFTFTVVDTGVGVPSERRRGLFIKFQRSDAARRMNAGGMGLGLYIVKGIIERHRGEVSFDSAEGKGSIFRFTLPPPKRA